MAINVERANAYFKESSTLGDVWAEYTAAQKSAAVTQAKRELSRALGQPVNENEPEYRLGDRVRVEYAVYEQALYTLMRDAQPKGSGAATPSLEPDEVKPTVVTSTGKGQWSQRALAWLGALQTVTRLGS